MTSEGTIEVPPRNWGLLIFAILSYSVVSLAVVYYNWWLFTSGFRYPVFVSWIQQCVGFLIFLSGSGLARYFRSMEKIFPAPAIKPATCLKVLPLSAAFVLTIGLSNICLQKTLISTYQVARSLTLPFVILLSYLLLKEKQSKTVLAFCSLMVIGFIIGSLDPTTLSLGGLLAGASSSFFQSLYNVLIKSTIPAVDGDNQKLLLYNVLLSSFLFIPMQFASEGLTAWSAAFSPAAHGSNGYLIWGSMVLSGVLGTTLNMTQYLVIHVTSPLTFNIVGFSKSIVQSLGGIVIFGDNVTIESAIGLGLCLVGSGGYAKAKHDQSRAAAALKNGNARTLERKLSEDNRLLQANNGPMAGSELSANPQKPYPLDSMQASTPQKLGAPSGSPDHYDTADLNTGTNRASPLSDCALESAIASKPEDLLIDDGVKS